MTFQSATIAGSILDFLDGVQSARVTGTRLEGGVSDGDDVRLGGLDVQYSSTKTAPEPVVATGTYAIVIERLAGGQPFKKRTFTAPIAGDTSWGELLAYDGTGYEYTPDELARLVAVEQAIENGGGGNLHDTYADLGTWDDDSAITVAGTYALTLDADTTIDLPDLDDGAAVLLWIDPSGSTRTATVAGYTLTVTELDLATFQRIRGTWRLVSGPLSSTAPTPVAADFPLSFTDADGTVSDSVLIPTTAHVTYRRGGTDLDPGVLTVSSLDTYPTVSISAVAETGYVIDGTSTWSHTFTTTSAPTEVTPAAVTFDDQPGTGSDTYTVPATTGVVYEVGGTTKTAGTYPGTGTVTVVASAASGYVIASGATTSWSTTFATTGGGGGGGTPVVALNDTFTGTDGTILDGRTPDTGPAWVRGYAWAGNHGEGSSYPDLVLASNKLVRTTIGGSSSTHYVPFSNQALSTFTASLDYAWQQTDVNQGAAVTLRVNWSGNDSLLVQIYRDDNSQPAGMRFGEHTTGTVTGSIPSTGTLSCVVTGTAVVISINGTQVATATLDQAITQLKSYTIQDAAGGASDSAYARFAIDNAHLEYTA